MKRSLTFSSDSGCMAGIRQEIREFLSDHGIEENSAELIVLALDEACTNIMRHAYCGSKKKVIRMSLEFDGGRLTCILRDYGKSCDPDKIRSRDLTDFRPGGLGVRIMQTAFDTVTFEPQPRGTRLELVRHFEPGGTRPPASG